MKTLTQTETQTAQSRQTAQNLIQQVCKLTGWSYERYCTYQFNNYIEFVDRMFEHWPLEMANQVKYSSAFRRFWNEEAAYRNQTEFLPYAKFEPVAGSILISEFLYTHHPLSLLHDDLFMTRYNDVLQCIRKEEDDQL